MKKVLYTVIPILVIVLSVVIYFGISVINSPEYALISGILLLSIFRVKLVKCIRGTIPKMGIWGWRKTPVAQRCCAEI